jgi:hypothetical protein
LPNSSVSRFEENRSVTKASSRPSGDHSGSRSAKASLVSWRRSPLSMSQRKRSMTPPTSAEKAMRRPSGDQAGL